MCFFAKIYKDEHTSVTNLYIFKYAGSSKEIPAHPFYHLFAQKSTLIL